MRIRANLKPNRTTVNVAGIQSLFAPSGSVARHAQQSGRKIRLLAAVRAPTRSGELARSHGGPKYATTHLQGHITIWNDAPHARFVHEGTTGPILPRNPTGRLWMRPAPHSWFPFNDYWALYGGRTPVPSVRGQGANPWMADAMRDVVHHTYL